MAHYPVNPLDSNDPFEMASHRELLAWVVDWIYNHSAGGSVTIRKAGVDVGTRAALNLIEGANVSINAVDDAPDGEVEITITVTGGVGDPGPQGPPGIPGADGEDGEFFIIPGARGQDGAAGAPGSPGAVGPAGQPGMWGFDGEEGAEGPPGQQGARGAQGAAGTPGAAGAAGSQGIPGFDGRDGEDAFPYPGPEGPRGPQGTAGSPGAAGPAGPPGLGIPGQDGEDGDWFPIPGPAGPKGDTGAPGGGGGSATTVEVNLGSTLRTAGKFTITDAGISPTSKVLVWQAPGPYTGKGTQADEGDLAPINITVVVPGSGSAVVRWSSALGIVDIHDVPKAANNFQTAGNANSNAVRAVEAMRVSKVLGRVRGNVKFSYMILA